LLFHPHLGITVTLLESPSESFSSPRWLATPYGDELFWVASHQKIYAMSANFAEIEQMISAPLQSQLPLSLQAATLIWTEESGTIQSISPSPDGRYLAFLREYEDQFTIVVLDVEQTPVQRIAELPTAWLPRVLWTPDGQALLLAREIPQRFVALGDRQIPVGEIVRHEITTDEQTVLVRDVALYNTLPMRSLTGLGPVALTSDGSTLYYTTLTKLRLPTVQDLRLGLYSVDLIAGARKLLLEFPAGEGIINELVVAPNDGRRLAFTRVGYQAGVGFTVQSALYLIEGDQVQRLAEILYGWFFPLWLDDAHLAYVQFQLEMRTPAGVQPALWVHNVETGERYNHLPLLTMQAQMESLRVALRQLQERVASLEQALQELQER
jgi:hypothetical protein